MHGEAQTRARQGNSTLAISLYPQLASKSTKAKIKTSRNFRGVSRQACGKGWLLV